jgi:hypothetical protein
MEVGWKIWCARIHFETEGNGVCRSMNGENFEVRTVSNFHPIDVVTLHVGSNFFK